MVSNVGGARDKVKSQVKLEAVAEAYGVELTPISHNDVGGLCPFHDEDTPSFAISIPKQVYYCYGCKAKGDVFSFVQAQEQVQFVDAIELVASGFGVDISEFQRPATEEEKRRRSYIDAMEARAFLAMQERSGAFWEYVEGRGLGKDIVDLFQLGWSEHPTVDADTTSLQFDKKSMWTQTIVVPVHDMYGNVVGFRNRGTRKGSLKVVASSKEVPIEQPVIYGFNLARLSIMENDGLVYVVEGEGDLWQMFNHGYTNTICSLGSKLSANTIRELHANGVSTIVVIPDQDKAGREFAKAVAKLRVPGVTIQIVSLPEGDPDDLLRKAPEEFENSIRLPTHGIDYIVRSEAALAPRDTLSQRLSILDRAKRALGGMTGAEMAIAAEVAVEVLGLEYQTALDYLREVNDEPTRLYDTALERDVLAAALSSPEACGEVFTHIRPEDFYLDSHQVLASALWDLYVSAATPSRTAVALKIPDPKILDTIPDGRSPDHFLLSHLADLSGKRRLVDLSRGIVSAVSNRENTVKDAANEAITGISRIVVRDRQVADASTLVTSAMDRIMERMRDPKSIIGYDLGGDLHTLNHTIHGVQANRYMVLAGGSGTGKTALMAKVCRRLATRFEVPSLILSFETGKEVITDRLIAGEANVHLERMMTGKLTPDEVTRVMDAAAIIGAAPIEITESGRTFEEAAAIIRHKVLTSGVQAVYLDYIQLMHLADAQRMGRYLELGQISGRLLELTQELGIFTCAVAQLNRDGAKKGGTSGGHDVGDSFRIFQDADIFVSYMERDKDDIELRGPEFGNRVMQIDKNRKDGKDDVRCYMLADLAHQQVKEIVK